jgi:hypothetical protein
MVVLASGSAHTRPSTWPPINTSRNFSAYVYAEGPRFRVCAHETLCLAPHRREGKFSRACVCRFTFKHLTQPLRSHIQTFGTLG